MGDSVGNGKRRNLYRLRHPYAFGMVWVRLFALSTARLAFRYARAHKHDGLGSIAIRCVRCAPLAYDGAPSEYAGPMPTEPVADGKVLRLADLQARDMDSREVPPDAPPF